MPLAKDGSSAAQVTATGVGATLSTLTAYGADLGVRHVNGTGTITVQGSAVVEWRRNGGTIWYTITTLTFGTIASEAREATIAMPDGAAEIRLDYTAPTGSTGHTLDYEIGRVTGV